MRDADDRHPAPREALSSAEELRQLDAKAHRAQPARLEEEHERPDDMREDLAAERGELERTRRELARREGYAEALQAQLDVWSLKAEDLRAVNENLNAQLLERDDEIAGLRHAEASLREEVSWRRGIEQSLRREIEDLNQRLAAIEGTRLWRVGARYWGLKQRARRTGRRP